jgi:hypothetical protein
METLEQHLEMPSSNGIGKIIVLAPSGTRDIVLHSPNNTPILYIPDGNQFSNRTTFSTLISRAKKSEVIKNNIFLVGTNTIDAKS